MTFQIDVPQLYRGCINVWVEDPVSAAWFSAVWADSDIRILIAGGQDAVGALARHAQENNLENVFGVVDQDFGTSNDADWFASGKTFRRFVLPVHEAENLFLDADSMASCAVNNTSKTTEQIENRMQLLADQSVSWLACRATMTELRHLVLDDFPSHPSRDIVPDLAAAESEIVESPWFRAIIPKTSAKVTTDHVRRRLQHFEEQYQADLTSGCWKQTFSGKELFRDATSYFYQAPQISGQSRDIDAAMAIAAWQVANNCIPKAASDLRLALQQRVGI